MIVNYDAFSVSGRRTKSGRLSKAKNAGGRTQLFRELKNWGPQLMVLDESHRIKSPSARKTKLIWKLGWTCEYRVIATGTPITKKKRVFDIYSQWKFLNPARFAHVVDSDGHATLNAFRGRYGVWLQRKGWEQWVRNKNEKELHRLVHMDSFAVTREQCFDLPPRTYQINWVHLDESREVYQQMAEDMIARIETGEITEASIRLVQLLRLHQISSGLVKDTEDKLHRIGREKLRAFEEWASDLFEAEEKIVVAARFRGDIAGAVEVCNRLKVPVWELHGGIDPKDRPPLIKQFANHRGAGCFVMQPDAGSLGIDLRTAAIFAWLSLTPSWVNYDQSMDRIALSDKPTFFHYFLASGTVDEVLYETLKEDGDVARAVLQKPDLLLGNLHSHSAQS